MKTHAQRLKIEGHKYIDKLVSLGMVRRTVYKRLADKLGTMYGEHHFSKMNSIPRLRKAVKFLKNLSEHQEGIVGVKLPQEEMKKLLAKHKPVKSWWEKLLCR